MISQNQVVVWFRTRPHSLSSDNFLSLSAGGEAHFRVKELARRMLPLSNMEDNPKGFSRRIQDNVASHRHGFPPK